MYCGKYKIGLIGLCINNETFQLKYEKDGNDTFYKMMNGIVTLSLEKGDQVKLNSNMY